MAAALVGGAFLSSFLNVVFDRLSSPEVIKWFKAKKVDEKLLVRLETSLCVVQAVLNDAEQRQITDPYVKKWLFNLEDAVYKADDLLDEVRTKAATTHKEDPGNIWTRYFNSQDSEMVSRIQEVIGTLEELAKHKDILSLREVANANMPRRIQTTSLVDRSEIFGRDEDKEKIIELLLSDTSDAVVSVIPIVGMGGVGKTTLSQLVYNDDKLEGKFDCKAWVCVGEEFDIVKVTKSILSAVTSSSCDKDDLNSLQNDLKQKLSGKKFLVVLDDMWNDRPDEWKILKKPFLHGNKGSVVLVTTRSDNVAFVVHTLQPYKLELLPEEHCWSMFVKHAFNSTESLEFSTLEEIGRKIVDKCKRLPLAVETLGSLLRTNYDANYWDGILKSEIWQTWEDKMRIIPALRISYHYLPSHLKRCFSFCSLYPKDHEFDKDELVLLWMAEDFFVQPNGVKTLEEIGYEYFNELVARSFFQPSNTRKGLFVMHDLIHDLAILCAGEFYFRYEPGKAKEIGNIGIKTRHLSHVALGDKFQISNLLEACDRLEHSRTFLIVKSRWQIESLSNMDDAICTLLSHLKCLKVLSLNNFPLRTLPHSIGALIHMRYLDLSHTHIEILPESLSRLYNLQTLELQYCYALEMLPSGMQDLVNLRYLDISGTRLEEMPKGMSKMKHLQFLSDYIVGKHEDNKIKELGALVNLHGSLDISHLGNVINGNEASEARMSEKRYVNTLQLSWSSNRSAPDSMIERDILDKLRPHQDLKKLSVHGYRGTIFPDWLGHSSYKQMTRLELYGCKDCCMLPSLGQLPSLNYLCISKFDSLISIGAEFYRGDESCQETPFPSLETLIIYGLEFLEEWHSIEYAFPQLKELEIRYCPVLRKNLPSHLPKLEKLIIDAKCKKLECFLPRAPAMLELDIPFISELRMQELPPSISSLRIKGSQLVESVFEAMSRTQPTRLQSLSINACDSVISFPGDCVPASLQLLGIYGCKKLDFPTQQQHQSLQELRINCSCDSLVSFPLSAFPNLRELDISGCENMESLVVSQSHDATNSRLRRLRISNCPKFVSFSPKLGMAAPQLEHLLIGECPEIESFGVVEGGLPPNLRELSIKECEKLGSNLASMDLSSQRLTRLEIKGGSESVKSFPKEGCLPASLESLQLGDFPGLETLDCGGLSHLTSLQYLGIWGCEKMENMTGERLPASLTFLAINGCPVLGERCKEKDPLIWPKISHIKQILINRAQIH